MNITDIFFNNGQLNWDAINVISNIILVAALVGVTAWYAREVKRQTAIMIGERNKILEQVQDVLTPTIHLLKAEIEAILDNEIFWCRDRSGEGRFHKGLSKLPYDNKKERSATFRDIIKKSSGLENKFHSHNVLYDKLNESYAKIEGEVKTPELTERFNVLMNIFNESRDGDYRLRGEAFDEPERIFCFLNFIINFRYQIVRSPDTIQPRIDFWEENRDELLKFRDTPLIKELDKEIEDVLSQLKKLDEALLKKIEAIRGKYRLKYNFTKYEIDPKLREVEEW